jgi:HAD-superfamily hydrolase, subfamily IIB
MIKNTLFIYKRIVYYLYIGGKIMTKAIFFDIDGTLISNTTRRISPKLIEAFNKLRKKGILLFIATGRHYREIRSLQILEDFQFDGYITLNGCYCYTQDAVVYKAIIDKRDVKKVIDIVNKRDIACLFVEADKFYLNKVNTRVLEAQQEIHTPLPNIVDSNRALENDIYQLIPYITDEEVDLFLEVTNNCKGTRWHPYAYDIIPDLGGKEEGIKKMLSHYNITKEATMAFGDGHNDIGMLQYVNIGICMANGEDLTKKSSDFITKSVDDDGILYALQHFGVI